MPKETKKRKLNSSAAAATSQSKTSTASTDKKALKEILKTCHGPPLAETLLDAIDDAPPATIQALKDLMAPLIYAVANPKHCLRCHESYDESSNHRKACVTLCDVPDYPTSRKDGEGYYEFPCCGKEVTETELDYGDYEVCYKASHTDDPEEVGYYSPPKHGPTQSRYNHYNNSTVIPCGEKGSNSNDSTE